MNISPMKAVIGRKISQASQSGQELSHSKSHPPVTKLMTCPTNASANRAGIMKKTTLGIGIIRLGKALK
jgi:hypothetical protein